mgnify:FL=1
MAQAELKISAGLPSQFPRDRLPQIAFSGRSNVGKSSLINTLLGRKALARVSSSPGKTITVNFYTVDGKYYFVDLPGYGFAKRPEEDKRRWSALTDGYFTKNPNIDCLRAVVQLVDSRIGATKDDLMMIDFMNRSGLSYIIAATKTDKLNRTEREKNLAALAASEVIAPGTVIIPFSSLKGEGKDELTREILRRVAEK